MIMTLARLALLGSAFILAQPAAAAGAVDPCPMGEEMPGLAGDIAHIGAQLHAGKHLDVLAVGSATMFGPEASLSPGTVTSQALGATPAAPAATVPPSLSERAFPLQMAKQLRTQVPGLDVDVTVRGGRGLPASEMLEVIRKELALKRYDVVIWQTGTVEAVRNVPPGEFGQILADGAQAVQATGADLVLVDPQYSRFLQTNSNLDPYFQALQQVAALQGVVLFRRYDLMRGWANDGTIDLERTSRSNRDKAITTLHACLGQHLARMLMAAMRD